MQKLVSNQLSPNFTFFLSLKVASNIRFLWNRNDLDFKNFLETKNYKLFNSARTALAEIAKSVELRGKKIGLPAVCCATMVTPFLSQGQKIEWIDTTPSGLLDLDDFASKASNIGLVLVPHIFGQKVNMKNVAKIARENNIFVVEDGAHLLNPLTPGADCKILSFGREKDVSSISGGALLWSKKCKYTKKFAEISLPSPSKLWTLRHLLQPLILSLSLPWWHRGGRFLAGIISKLKILPRAVTPKEKRGIEDFALSKMPRAMQEVLSISLSQRKKHLSHSKKLASLWQIAAKKYFLPPKSLFRPIFFALF